MHRNTTLWTSELETLKEEWQGTANAIYPAKRLTTLWSTVLERSWRDRPWRDRPEETQPAPRAAKCACPRRRRRARGRKRARMTNPPGSDRFSSFCIVSIKEKTRERMNLNQQNSIDSGQIDPNSPLSPRSAARMQQDFEWVVEDGRKFLRAVTVSKWPPGTSSVTITAF